MWRFTKNLKFPLIMSIVLIFCSACIVLANWQDFDPQSRQCTIKQVYSGWLQQTDPVGTVATKVEAIFEVRFNKEVNVRSVLCPILCVSTLKDVPVTITPDDVFTFKVEGNLVGVETFTSPIEIFTDEQVFVTKWHAKKTDPCVKIFTTSILPKDAAVCSPNSGS